MADEPADTVAERIGRALKPEVPNYYVNGFANGLGSGDVILALEKNGTAVASVNLSYTMAKTLAISLSQLIANLESATTRTMLTSHEMDEALQKMGEEPK